MKAFHKLGILFVALLAWSGVASAQKWVLPTFPPPFRPGVALQLTDGKILVQDSGTGAVWWLLIPDEFGHYDTGVWVPVINNLFNPGEFNYNPTFFASAVLRDGKVIVEGGEDNNGVQNWTNLGMIFNPVTLEWKQVSPPNDSFGFPWANIGDAQSVVLADGTFMLGRFDSGTIGSFSATAEFALLDEKTLKWTDYPGTGKFDGNDEEGWTLLPGGDVLTVDNYCSVFPPNGFDPNGTNSEVFSPKTKTWTSAGSTGAQLWDPVTCEIGPAVLRPDGTVFATGANSREKGRGKTPEGKETGKSKDDRPGKTAIYDTRTKTWTKGPNFPGQDDIADGSAAVLPDGNVLVDTNPGYGENPSTLYEFDGTQFLKIPQPTGLNPSNTEGGRMLVTAEGTIMFLHIGSPNPPPWIWFYHPAGKYKEAWRPHIVAVDSFIVAGTTDWVIKGTQFNGLTQGAYFGDDAQSATNYPLVRIRNDATGHVFFARTHDFSTMAVATGSEIVSTKFDVSAETEIGESHLEVIANGIPSVSVRVFVAPRD